MRLLSVNLGKAELLRGARTPRLTGIDKRSATSPVTITVKGLSGDAVCDPKYHGGPDQAVYIYGAPDYGWWEEQLGHPIAPGTFGDNLTITEWESSSAVVGDRFHIGPVTLEVTSPRIPCSTLSRHMEDSTFVKKFRVAERPGVYCRVLSEGTVQADDPVTYEPYSGANALGILELYHDGFVPAKDGETLRRHLAAPIAIRLRLAKEKLLAKL